jgi:hypothetical protein
MLVGRGDPAVENALPKQAGYAQFAAELDRGHLAAVRGAIARIAAQPPPLPEPQSRSNLVFCSPCSTLCYLVPE